MVDSGLDEQKYKKSLEYSIASESGECSKNYGDTRKGHRRQLQGSPSCWTWAVWVIRCTPNAITLDCVNEWQMVEESSLKKTYEM